MARKNWGVGIPEYKDTDLMSDEDFYNFAVERSLYMLKDRGFELKKIWFKGEFIAQLLVTKKEIEYMVIVRACKEEEKWSKCPETEMRDIKSEELKALRRLTRKTDTVPFQINVAFRPVDDERYEKDLMLKNDQYLCRFFISNPGLRERIFFINEDFFKEPKQAKKRGFNLRFKRF